MVFTLTKVMVLKLTKVMVFTLTKIMVFKLTKVLINTLFNRVRVSTGYAHPRPMFFFILLLPILLKLFH